MGQQLSFELAVLWDGFDLGALVVWSVGYGIHVEAMHRMEFFVITGLLVAVGAVLLWAGNLWKKNAGYHGQLANLSIQALKQEYHDKIMNFDDRESADDTYKCMMRHLRLELMYDIAQIAVITWLLEEIELTEEDWTGKVLLDGLNIATTFVDLFLVKGSAAFTEIGGNPADWMKLMAGSMEDLEQKAKEGIELQLDPSDERFIHP